MIHRLLLATESSPNRLLTKVKPAPLCTGFLPNLFKFRMSKRLQKRGAFAQCKPVHHIPFKIPSLGRPHARWRPPGWRWSRGVRSGRARAGRRILAACFSRRDSRSTNRPFRLICKPFEADRQWIWWRKLNRSHLFFVYWALGIHGTTFSTAWAFWIRWGGPGSIWAI